MSELIHKHHNNPFKSWHLFALTVPTLVFVAVLALFVKSGQPVNIDYVEVTTPEPKLTIQVGERTIQADVADDEQERRIGLSKHKSLSENEGMLFVWETKDIPTANFWMKDMDFPIDILWIDDGVVEQIHANAEPEPGVPDREMTFYVPNSSFDYVLEVNAGFAEEHGIEPGTEIQVGI